MSNNTIEYIHEPTENITQAKEGELVDDSAKGDISTAISIIDDESKRQAVIKMFSEDNGLDPLIDEIRSRVKSEVFDVTTKAGRDRIGSVARQIGSAKVKMQEYADSLTEDQKKAIKLVTSEKTRMSKEMDALRDSVLAPRDEFESREKKRVEERESRLAGIAALVTTLPHDATVSVIEQAIQSLEHLRQYDWQEFADRAQSVSSEASRALSERHTQRVNYEAEQAELERLRKAEEDRLRKEREDQIAKEAAENAKKEAEEKAAKEAEERAKKEQEEKDRLQREKEESDARAAKAEEDRIASEKAAAERERVAAEQAEQYKRNMEIAAKQREEMAAKAERDRIAAEQKKKDDAEKARAADVEHRKTINNAARVALMSGCGLTEAQAVAVITAIAKGEVQNITINY